MNFEQFEKLVGKDGQITIGKEGDWILTLRVPDSDWFEAETILGFVSESFGFGENKQYKNKIIKGSIQFDSDEVKDVAISKDFMKKIGQTKITEAMKWFDEHRNEGYAFQIGDTEEYVMIKDLTLILTLIFTPEKLKEEVFRDFMNKVRG